MDEESNQQPSNQDAAEFKHEFGISMDLESEIVDLRREGECVDALIEEENRRHEEWHDDLARQRQLAEIEATDGAAEIERLRTTADATFAVHAEHCARAIALIDRAAKLGPLLPRVAEERARLDAEASAAAVERDTRLKAAWRDCEGRVAALAAAQERAEAAMRASEAALSALADRRERVRRRLVAAELAWAEARQRDEQVALQFRRRCCGGTGASRREAGGTERGRRGRREGRREGRRDKWRKGRGSAMFVGSRMIRLSLPGQWRP